MNATAHSTIRCQQRGVSPFMIDLLLRFGRREHDHHGAEVIFFDRRAKKAVEIYTGGTIGKHNEQMDSYVVVSEGCVITAGVRLQKINRH